jgi:predicted S18 family serine protease
MLVLAGCANDPAPSEQMRLSIQAVEQARAVGADPQIEEMREAERKLARAEKNMGEEDFKRARVFAEQAELDARLAEARVLNQKSRKQLDELNARITHLRKQLGELP